MGDRWTPNTDSMQKQGLLWPLALIKTETSWVCRNGIEGLVTLVFVITCNHYEVGRAMYKIWTDQNQLSGGQATMDWKYGFIPGSHNFQKRRELSVILLVNDARKTT